MDWEEDLAQRVTGRAAGQAQESVAVNAERARAEGLASRSTARAIGRRGSLPPTPEWARRAAAGAGYDVDPLEDAA
ncbi:MULTISPECIES: hypothetical protein [unclassified Kitasatospora]|uniref:hypothetical protein n=1 Tax=unclassified Kitasatospora TaxID=2633591 RepID=UPI000712E5DA|nr:MULTISPECIES: hypothetical protein [unclassified Kitasatospora]KQV20550.1 hypothetical protein ASC99_21050 [Kitasatospora sp. Root107]